MFGSLYGVHAFQKTTFEGAGGAVISNVQCAMITAAKTA